MSGHFWEIFYNSVRILVGRGDLKGRLIKAATELHVLTDGEIPKEKWDEFNKLKRELTVMPDKEGGAITATVNSMTEDKASECALKIVEIYNWACKKY